ncbi:MAG: hypothetical protein ACRC2K_08120 [Clostridium sp.]
MNKNIKKDVLEFNFDLKDNTIAMQLYSFVALILMGWKLFFGNGSTWDNNAGIILGILSIVGGILAIKYRKLNGTTLVNLNWQGLQVNELKWLMIVKNKSISFKDVKSIRLTETKVVIEEEKRKTTIKVQYIERSEFKALRKYLDEISRKYRIQIKSM